MTVAPERLDAIVPLSAGWFAGDDVYEAYIGPPLRLAGDARRLDTSPAWFSWVGALPALELLDGSASRRSTSTTCAWRTASARAMGLEPSNSAIVSLDGRRPRERCARRASRRRMPGGRLRVGFHLYNDEEDADRAVDVLQ